MRRLVDIVQKASKTPGGLDLGCPDHVWTGLSVWTYHLVPLELHLPSGKLHLSHMFYLSSQSASDSLDPLPSQICLSQTICTYPRLSKPGTAFGSKGMPTQGRPSTTSVPFILHDHRCALPLHVICRRRIGNSSTVLTTLKLVWANSS